MGDPLSITASVVGITTAALQSIQFLVRAIDGVKGAPDSIRTVSADLNVMQPVLQDLLKALQDKSSQIVLSEQIKGAVENCDRACGTFRLQLNHWMERSTQDKMFWVDRWKIGLFGLERIKTFRGQLSDCKGTLSVALNTATIITTTRQQRIMQEIKDTMLKQQQAEIWKEITKAGDETRDIELDIQQLPASISDTLTATSTQLQESEQSRRELLYELEQHKAANQAFVNMCHEALHHTKEQRTVQRINNNKVTNNSRMLTGFMNATAEQSKIDQHISNNMADDYSVFVGGVANNIDFSNFVPQRP